MEPHSPVDDQWPLKAYNDFNFLNSPDARPIRVLCEFLEPKSRFRKERIQDTIVMFGSARILAPETALENLAAVQREIGNAPEAAPELKARLDQAQREVHMARYYSDAAELAERLTQWSLKLPKKGYHFTICSGGGPGIMEAANRGAHQAGGKSVSLNVSLPHEQVPNPYQTHELAFEFHYFFIRKFWFVYLAKALIVFPGGFGTMDELFEVLTLIQTQKARKTMPVVLYGSEYWNEVVHFEAFVKWGMISPEDLSLFRVCDTVDDAFTYLEAELTRLYLDKKGKPDGKDKSAT